MRLRWVDKEVVTIPDVGQVKPGVEFTIDDDRAQDLLFRKVAERVTPLQESPLAIKKTTKMTVDDAVVKEH